MLNELAKEIHENAIRHDWWEEERSFPEIIALCHSELSEALEEYRENAGKWFANMYYVKKPPENALINLSVIMDDFNRGYSGEKPEGIAIELADCIIRILDYCGRKGLDIDAALALRRAGNDTYSLPELLAECHCLLSCAYKGIEPRLLYFAECINLIQFWCKENGIDIDAAIRIKHEYNKTRPYRHGGKRASARMVLRMRHRYDAVRRIGHEQISCACLD